MKYYLLSCVFSIFSFWISAQTINPKILKQFNPATLGKRVVFNDNGIGLLYGFQRAGNIGRDPFMETIYKFVLYRTIDGVNWTEVKIPLLASSFLDTLDAYNDSKNATLSLHSYCNMDRIYLSGKGRTFVTKDGLKWEPYTYKGKDLEEYLKPGWDPFASLQHVNSTSNLIVFYRYTGIDAVFLEKDGEWKKLSLGYLEKDNHATPNIVIRVGRKIKFHAYDDYFYLNRQFPFYILPSGNRDILKAAADNNLLTNYSFETSYIYPKTVYMTSINSKRIFADFGYLGYYTSNDGGQSFVSMKSKLPVKSIEIFSLTCTEGTIYIAGYEKNAYSGKLFKSTDSGETWTPIMGLDVTGSIPAFYAPDWGLDYMLNGQIIVNSISLGAFALKDKCK